MYRNSPRTPCTGGALTDVVNMSRSAYDAMSAKANAFDVLKAEGNQNIAVIRNCDVTVVAPERFAAMMHQQVLREAQHTAEQLKCRDVSIRRLEAVIRALRDKYEPANPCSNHSLASIGNPTKKRWWHCFLPEGMDD